MAGSRYDSKRPKVNTTDVYEELREERGVSKITHYQTANLTHPTVEQRRQLERIGHIWKVGDRFYKLAHAHYGDTRYWWVIAWYNKKPTESHIKIGDTIKIPHPLHKVLGFMRNE
jgi:nucleoid-associated protein YgaU